MLPFKLVFVAHHKLFDHLASTPRHVLFILWSELTPGESPWDAWMTLTHPMKNQTHENSAILFSSLGHRISQRAVAETEAHSQSRHTPPMDFKDP